MDVMVVACATASHAAPVLRMSAPTQSRSPSCASAARGRDNRAGMPHWQAVTWTFAVCASLIVGHRIRGNDRLLTDERPIDGARAPPLLPCAADEFRFLDASVSDRRSRSLFCKGAARSNPSNRGDPFLASLRAIMGEGGMDKSAPPGAAARPPGVEGTVHVRAPPCYAMLCSASHF